MRHIYEVTYNRLPQEESAIKSKVYAEGHFRTIQMVASSEEEALEIAEKRLAKQFPGDGIESQSNYKLQGITIKVENV